MPDVYAPSAKVLRVCEIVGDQMRALDGVYKSSRLAGGLPLFGGFAYVSAWRADPDKE